MRFGFDRVETFDLIDCIIFLSFQFNVCMQ